MIYLKKLLPLFLFFGVATASAQIILPVSTTIQKTYTKGTRTKSGEPGKNYWQNTASYSIKVNFNPKTRLLSGTAGIDYVNNSPDTLKKITFKLYPNLYQKGAARDRGISPADVTDGVQIQSISLDGQPVDSNKRRIAGTNMSLRVKPISPKQKVHFDIAYSYT
ncbi:MAG TPA: peptidase, partial [Mucilaginibacter sp.]